MSEKKKTPIEDLIISAQHDFVRREDAHGNHKEPGLHSITEAARLATGAKLAQFNILEQDIQTTIVSSGKGSRRGATLNVEQTFCQHVVQNPQDEITMIHAHPKLGKLWPNEYQEGKGFYAGIGIRSPYDETQKLGTLCVMDPGSSQEILIPDGETGMGKEQLLRNFAHVIEAQLKARTQLKNKAKDIKKEVKKLQKTVQSRDLSERAHSNFSGMSMRELVELAEDVGIDDIDKYEDKSSLVTVLKEHSSRHDANQDYARLPFRKLLGIAEEREIENLDDVESKAELISLLEAYDKKHQQPDYASMSFRTLFALAEERGLSGVDDVESKAELIALLERNDEGEKEPDYDSMSFRALIALAEEKGVENLDDVESKKQLVGLLKATQKDSSFAHPRHWVDPADIGNNAEHLPWLKYIEETDLAFDPYTPVGLGSLPPIRKDDAERVACVRSYGLLDPNPVPDPFLNEICTSAAKLVGPTAFCIMNILGDELAIQIAHYMPAVLGGTPPPPCMPRGTQVCNFVVYKNKPVVFPQEAMKAGTQGAMQFYTGIPMQCPTTGHALGSFCIMDGVGHPELTEEDVTKLKMLCTSAMHHIELRKLRLDVFRLSNQRQALEQDTLSRRGIPKGDSELTTFVCTDIEGSTALWEFDPSAMNKAQRLHDALMRKTLSRYDGYEIGTEGDAFSIAFHTPSDALAFCTRIQKEFLNVQWPSSLLTHPKAQSSGNGAWCGLRLRAGMHCGKTKRGTHPVSKKITFGGLVLDTTRHIGDAGHGGQVLLSAQAWSTAQLNAEKLDVAPIHLGTYALSNDEEAQLLQVLPRALSQKRDMSDRPIRKCTQLMPGYFDAPSGTQELIVGFILIAQREEVMLHEEVAQEVFPLFQTIIQKELQQNRGYLCQEEEGTYMVVFSDLRDAVEFSTTIHTTIRDVSWPESLHQTSCTQGLAARVGLFSGTPVEKRPHSASGRADYFGPVLNRAARMAYAAHPGRTLLPHYLVEQLSKEDQDRCVIQSVGQHAFKGIEELFDIDDIALSETLAPPILSTVTLEKFNSQLLEAMKGPS